MKDKWIRRIGPADHGKSFASLDSKQFWDNTRSQGEEGRVGVVLVTCLIHYIATMNESPICIKLDKYVLLPYQNIHKIRVQYWDGK
jgi:hypothetical protein